MFTSDPFLFDPSEYLPEDLAPDDGDPRKVAIRDENYMLEVANTVAISHILRVFVRAWPEYSQYLSDGVPDVMTYTQTLLDGQANASKAFPSAVRANIWAGAIASAMIRLEELQLRYWSPEQYSEWLKRAARAGLQKQKGPPGDHMPVCSNVLARETVQTFMNPSKLKPQKHLNILWPTRAINSKELRGRIMLKDPWKPSQILNEFDFDEDMQHSLTYILNLQRSMNIDDADVFNVLVYLWTKGRDTRPVREFDGWVMVNIDDILEIIGYKKKLAGSGRRGGFEKEYRRRVWRSVLRCCSVHIEVDELLGRTAKGIKIGTLSGAIISIGERYRQLVMDFKTMADGTEVQTAAATLENLMFRFTISRAFQQLTGDPLSSQIAWLALKALQYNSYKFRWHKGLTYGVTYGWRINAKSGDIFVRSKLGSMIRNAIGWEDFIKAGFSRGIDRYSRTSDRITEDGVMAGWQFESDPHKDKLETIVCCEPPDSIKEQYKRIADNRERYLPKPKKPAPSAAEIGARLKAARKRARLSQIVLADQLQVDRTLISHIERGRRRAPKKVMDWIEAEAKK